LTKVVICVKVLKMKQSRPLECLAEAGASPPSLLLLTPNIVRVFFYSALLFSKKVVLNLLTLAIIGASIAKNKQPFTKGIKMKEADETVVPTKNETESLVKNRIERTNEELIQINQKMNGSFTILSLLSLGFFFFSSGVIILFSEIFVGLSMMAMGISLSGLSGGAYLGDKELDKRRSELETDEYLMISSGIEENEYRHLETKIGDENE